MGAATPNRSCKYGNFIVRWSKVGVDDRCIMMRSRISIAAMAAITSNVVVGLATAADSSGWLAASIPDGFTLTAVGDLIITAPISQRMKRTSPDLIKILQEADVTFGNFEASVLDVPNSTVIPPRFLAATGY
jgi:hypothetical protein